MANINPNVPTNIYTQGGGQLNLSLPAPKGRDAINQQLVDSASQLTGESKDELREAFHDFVGQTFFGQMLASMRATQDEAPYFNGGRAEKIFQGQLDQVLTEELSNASADKIADPMFKLFNLPRQ